jgi:transposase
MEVTHPRCAGLDVHQKTVVACVRIAKDSKIDRHVRTFSTTADALHELSDWLIEHEVTHVVMEATGVYWRPVWTALEDERLTLTLGNAAHIKNVPGRKTDVRDAEWLADLHAHGLVRDSFVPDAHTRALRDLTRTRKQLVRERTSHTQRIQKVLEGAGIKLGGGLVTDLLGKSGRSIVEGLIEGKTDPDLLLSGLDPQMEKKRGALRLALAGRVLPHHRILLRQHLSLVDELNKAIVAIDVEVGERLEPFREQVERLTEIPGVSRTAAQVLAAEIGLDMERFPSAAHLRSWAGLCPRNDESAGKQRSTQTRKANPWLKSMVVQCATAASRTKKSYLGAQYRRLKARRGHQKAVVAVAASILTIAYHMLTTGKPYKDLGVDYFARRDPEGEARRAIRRLQALGYEVEAKKAA